MEKDLDHIIYLMFLFFSLVLIETLEAGIELESIFHTQSFEKLAVDKINFGVIEENQKFFASYNC